MPWLQRRFDVAALHGRAAVKGNAADTCIGWICYYGSSKMRLIRS